MGNSRKIIVSAPCKVHLLGEHSVVYGKPAILAAIDLRVIVTVTANTSPSNTSEVGFDSSEARRVIDPIIKKYLKLKILPSYKATIDLNVPIGSGLGSSAAISAAYIGALLLFLRVEWNLKLINDLTFEAEKTFHGNPSGADNSTVVFGGLIWFRKETDDLKLMQKLPFSISKKLAKNFILINTGKPNETTSEMVKNVKNLSLKKPKVFAKFLEEQEKLVKELPQIIQHSKEKDLMRIIRQGENNLESIGVVSKFVQDVIREIEKAGGVGKICGGGGKTGATGVLLCYHPTPQKLIQIAKERGLEYYKINLGVEGLRRE